MTEHIREFLGTLADKPVTISFKHSYRLVVDPAYGADADGRRGVRQEFIEDEDVTDISVTLGNTTTHIETLHPDSQSEIMSEIAQFLETLEYD